MKFAFGAAEIRLEKDDASTFIFSTLGIAGPLSVREIRRTRLPAPPSLYANLEPTTPLPKTT